MDLNELLRNSLNDRKIFCDLQKKIQQNNSNLEKFGNLNFKFEIFDIIDINDIKNEVLFRRFFRAKIKAQHLLNMLCNKEYFKNTSKHLLHGTFNDDIQNDQFLLDEVTKSVLEYIILVYILKHKKDTTFKGGDILHKPAVNKKQEDMNFKFIIAKKTILKRPSVCTYCDTALEDTDITCPVCEAVVKLEECYEDNKGDISSGIPMDSGTINEPLLENYWTCFYCTQRNEEKDMTCITCLTVKRDSKEDLSFFEEESKEAVVKDEEYSNLIQDTDPNVDHDMESTHDHNGCRNDEPRVNEAKLRNKRVSLSRDDEDIKTSKMIKEISKVVPLPESSLCSWACTLCGYLNIDIDDQCQTCLTCFKEGKHRSINVENNYNSIVNKDIFDKDVDNFDDCEAVSNNNESKGKHGKGPYYSQNGNYLTSDKNDNLNTYRGSHDRKSSTPIMIITPRMSETIKEKKGKKFTNINGHTFKTQSEDSGIGSYEQQNLDKYLSSTTNERNNEPFEATNENCKVKMLPESSLCSWTCTLCGYMNKDIDDQCQTCLVCLEEGKYKDENEGVRETKAEIKDKRNKGNITTIDHPKVIQDENEHITKLINQDKNKRKIEKEQRHFMNKDTNNNEKLPLIIPKTDSKEKVLSLKKKRNNTREDKQGLMDENRLIKKEDAPSNSPFERKRGYLSKESSPSQRDIEGSSSNPDYRRNPESIPKKKFYFLLTCFKKNKNKTRSESLCSRCNKKRSKDKYSGLCKKCYEPHQKSSKNRKNIFV